MNNTQSVSATPDRRRRRVTRALLVLALTLGSLAVTARPVDAAGYVVTCYVRPGAPSIVSGFNVQLYAWNGGNPLLIDQRHTDAGGCASFLVPLHYQSDWVYTLVNHFAPGGFYFTGYSMLTYLYLPTSGLHGPYPQLVAPWGLAFAPPGNNIWFLVGAFWCELSTGGYC